MNADDLDHRARTLSGCITPALVSRLVELGHLGEVERQAGNGEWFCAREWALSLAGRGRLPEALEVLAPYAATGWWTAAATTADLMEDAGRVEEAIAVSRRHADAGVRQALGHCARLLARHGRGDEGFALLLPYVTEWYLAAALVDVAASAGRDEDAAVVLTARIAATEPHCDTASCRCHEPEPSNAVGLLAGIRERQGRVDEAITLLRTRVTTSVNSRDQLADLLARHHRIEELRAYAESDPHGHAAQCLAELLERSGDVEDAIAVYRRSPAQQGGAPVRLAQLLTRHGRGGEATEILRSLADATGGADDWIVDMLCTHYAGQGRARDGLAYLDILREQRGGEDWEFFRIRLDLMVACGLREDAIEQAFAHPEGDTWYAAEPIAALLAGAGRAEEAVAVLERAEPVPASTLAWHLIGLGRVGDAVAAVRQR